MSFFQTLIPALQNHYNSFRSQYRYTALLLVIATLGAFCATAGILSQKYFLSAVLLFCTIFLSSLILYRGKARKMDWEKLNRGWKFLFFALACLLLREIINLVLVGSLTIPPIALLGLSIISQVSLMMGLMILAWPIGKHTQIRALIDSLIIVLALLVMAWAKGIHPLELNLLGTQLHHDYLLSLLLWANNLSGVVLLMCILFHFIAAHNSLRPDSSTLWVSGGASLFLLIHIFRAYAVGDIDFGWNYLSHSYLTMSCGLVVFSIAFILTGTLWHQAIAETGDSIVPLSQINSQHRLITLWFPYGAALTVALILLIGEIVPKEKGGSGLLPIVLLLVAILSRQMLTMWDNLRLSQDLTGSNTNLENNVLERTQHLAILHSITSTLNSTLDKNSILKIALEQIMGATNAEQGAIWLRHPNVIDPNTTQWHLAYAKGLPGKNHEEVLRDVAIATVDDHIVSKEKTQDYFLEIYHFPTNNGKLVIVPIRSGGLLLGVQALILPTGKLNSDTRSVVESVALEVGTSLQNAQLYQEARQRADRDGVTGLYNHRAIQEELARLLQNAGSSGTSFSVLMMDLNDFKYFNDTYGHPVGDEVLRNVARQLEKISGPNNPVGRYGGDEFIILLPGQNNEQTHQTYQMLLARMKKEHFEVAPGVRIPINMSYGWSVFPDDGQSALDLITIADANLYRYKQRGDLEDEFAASSRRAASIDQSTAFGVLDALITAIDNKDHYTRKHSDEVSHYALLIAEKLGYSSESLRAVRISGLLHDVGKIAVPDDILRHPGKLSKADWEIMKGHPSFGALIVKDVPHLEDVITGIRYHHERWDGRGYPEGLAGTDIPIMGRLLAVPDTYSALTTNRPYRKGHSPQEALLEIRRSILTQFDPLIAKTFIEIMQRELKLNSLDEDNSAEEVLSRS
jgi:diguanylate cyclase (GGDEF)-like protein/putative nucleotidyltransferase with HDIG domain